jgi:UDP-N-acetylmuramoylalanine--D-glutamate ligase
MLNQLREFFAGKKVLLLGFGLEGKSTLRLLENLNCAESVTVWEEYHHTTTLPPEYDIIMKSPGIPLFQKIGGFDKRITGQADLFLRFCRNSRPKVVGITGTKGKSTTSSLLHHILTVCGIRARLIGNIGVPPLDIAGEIDEYEVVVAELSCHQLEYVQASPEIAVFLNLYEEHLDHYVDFTHYRHAKENIFRFQKPDDVSIFGLKSVDIDSSAIDIFKAKLRGVHNLQNMAAAVKAAVLLGIDEESAIHAAYSFGGLEHRLELFAEIEPAAGGSSVKWVNDSISTIPAAAIAAVEAFPETDTLIIGGMDRGIDYCTLVEFLSGRDDLNVIALPDSGHKIAEELPHAYKAEDMRDAVDYAKKVTKKCCVLSPAAASYGFYKNFEERGKHFKELARG